MRVFCASMADVFEWKKGLSVWREKLWNVVEDTPFLNWLLLTKRPHLVQRLAPWGNSWPDNVWLGTTVESQKWAEKRLPHLDSNPARIRFLSCEPLLGEIQLDDWLARKTVNWVIAGGESGPKARPTDPAWFHAVQDQCAAHATPFHFKQWGDWAPVTAVENSLPRAIVHEGFSTPMGRFGKKASGRLLNGRTWDQAPSIN